jgi:hypothetical protein
MKPEMEPSSASPGKSAGLWAIVLAASVVALLLVWWTGMRKPNVHGTRYLFPLGGIVLALANLLDSDHGGLYKIGMLLATGLWLASIILMLSGN